jgi:hypothetical protein
VTQGLALSPGRAIGKLPEYVQKQHRQGSATAGGGHHLWWSTPGRGYRHGHVKSSISPASGPSPPLVASPAKQQSRITILTAAPLSCSAWRTSANRKLVAARRFGSGLGLRQSSRHSWSSGAICPCPRNEQRDIGHCIECVVNWPGRSHEPPVLSPEPSVARSRATPGARPPSAAGCAPAADTWPRNA